jgi:hypothetical protein
MPAQTGNRTAVTVAAVVVSGAMLTACSPNAATFYEGTRLAFVTEYNAASGQPVNLTFGYKRRIVAIVPPQRRGADENSPHKGEALSLISTFEVEPGGPQVGDGLVIRNVFASGGAAVELTRDDDAEDKVEALFSAASIEDLTSAGRRRRDALLAQLKTMDNSRAAAVLAAAQLRPVPPRRCRKDKDTEARCTLKDVLSRAGDATVDKLEAAFESVR